MIKLPHYVTRYQVTKSTASENAFTVSGSVITGPNTGQYVTAKALTQDAAHEEFLKLADKAYRGRR